VMSLGTKNGAVPYCSGTITEKVRTKKAYEQYMKRILEKSAIMENDPETNQEQVRFACNIDFQA